jgi:hypothetical protein
MEPLPSSFSVTRVFQLHRVEDRNRDCTRALRFERYVQFLRATARKSGMRDIEYARDERRSSPRSARPFAAIGAGNLSRAARELAGCARTSCALVSIRDDGGQGTVALLERV